MSASSEYLDALVALSDQKAQAQAQAARQRGQIIGTTLQSLGQIVPQIQQARQQQQDRAAINQDRVAQAKLRDLQTQEAAGNLQQQQANQQGDLAAAQATSDLLQPQPDGSVTFDPVVAMQRMSAAGVPIAIAQKHLQALKEMNDLGRTFQATKVDRAAELADSFLRTHQDGEPVDPEALGLFADFAQKNGMTDQGSADALKQAAQRGGDPRKMLEGIRNLSPKFAKADKTAPLVPIPGPDGKPIYGTPTAGAPVYEKPPAGAPDRLVPVPGPNGKPVYGTPQAGAPVYEKPPESGGITGNAAADQANARTVAKGIKAGTQSPEILLTTRATSQGMALAAALEKEGVDSNKLAREWTGTKAAIRSLNSTQQVRLAETINKASASLDKLDELNQQWSDNATRWGVKVLNRASLKAAQNGAYGPEAASVAQRLDGQIADVTSELGQSIMGGGSPTDHALALASKNLSSDWTQKVLADSIGQVRYNLNLAQNARNEILGGLGVTGTQIQTPPPAAAPSFRVGPYSVTVGP